MLHQFHSLYMHIYAVKFYTFDSSCEYIIRTVCVLAHDCLVMFCMLAAFRSTAASRLAAASPASLQEKFWPTLHNPFNVHCCACVCTYALACICPFDLASGLCICGLHSLRWFACYLAVSYSLLNSCTWPSANLRIAFVCVLQAKPLSSARTVSML